eukprot:TRINITY_DN69598_c0_g1_i1.p1 TRINITY_DN69598_c0_g1~~TRINITY_DN69598_c0_g1_i1.p1  ORF type:complete len:197 (-),score=13.94 TRINITY_DN69598_c0_g1_i1:3-593(-)
MFWQGLSNARGPWLRSGPSHLPWQKDLTIYGKTRGKYTYENHPGAAGKLKVCNIQFILLFNTHFVDGTVPSVVFMVGSNFIAWFEHLLIEWGVQIVDISLLFTGGGRAGRPSPLLRRCAGISLVGDISLEQVLQHHSLLQGTHVIGVFFLQTQPWPKGRWPLVPAGPGAANGVRQRLHEVVTSSDCHMVVFSLQQH